MEDAPRAGEPTPDDRRNARLYLIGIAASMIGDSALSLVAGIWIKSLTGSSAEAGLASVAVYAPSMLGPLAGLLVDRVHRRPWLLAVNLGGGALVLLLLLVRSRQQIWLIDLVMLGYGTLIVLSGPAEDALFALMLPTDLRRRMNGWRLALRETGRLVAPLLGAGLFVVMGGGGVAVLDAATFGVAAATVGMLRVREPRPARRDRHWWREVTAGARHIWGTTRLRRVILAAAIVMAASAIPVAAQYSVVQALGEPPAFLGILSGLLGAGSIVASLVSGRLVARIGERNLALLGLLDFGAGSALRATGWLPAVLAGSALLGFALPWVFLAALNLAQRLTPLDLQGRVSAANTLLLFGPQAPLQALGSLLIAHTGYRQILVPTAAAGLLTAGWLAWPRRADDQTGQRS